jgi:5S rRNA maturation endonuclease (ribonuclease M5)/uncharacterized protein YdhG (YjbR/CyaY superfamily)
MNRIDIRAELEEFEWTRPQWHADKLLAASPFRYDRSPSFYVYLEDTPSAPAGSWGDSGAYDAEWAKGGFVKLLAFLHNETEEETADYLRDKYEVNIGSTLTLKVPTLKVQRNRQALTKVIQPQVSSYLTNRGITETAQRLASVGFDSSKSAVLIPWRLPDGRLANIKYRATWGKAFWYERGGIPIRELVYGIDRVYSERLSEVVLCEAEIDALTWESVGVRAIAVGGANFTDQQADVIKRSPIERLTICADNDKAGAKLRVQIVGKLRGFVELHEAKVPAPYKDVNEAHCGNVVLLNITKCEILSRFDVKL